MLSSFQKAYSPPQGNMGNLIFAIAFGIFVGGFLVFFAPFDLDNAPYPYQPYSIAFFGVISTIAIALMFYIIPKTFPKLFQEKYWKVWHQIIYLLLTIFIIATLNGMYINFIGDLEFSWSNYAWIIPRTFGVAIIPIVIGVLWDHNRKLQQNFATAQEIKATPSSNLEDSHAQLTKVNIYDNQRSLEYDTDDILYIEAEGNYLNLHIQENGAIKRIVQRSTLAKTEVDTSGSSLVRCHRSYMVNLRHISDVSGNAQGLRLTLNLSDFKVPVSRKYIADIKDYMQSKRI